MAKIPLHQSKSGDLWAKHSQGNCLFIMAVKKDDKGQNVLQQHSSSYWLILIELANRTYTAYDIFIKGEH